MVKTEESKLSTPGSTADNRIAIKVISQMFCERKGLELKSLSFTFDHRKVGGDQTPEQLGMEDGAEMEAHKSAFGG